jgi:predicted ATP pyrophosphatase (TIGR00289 family)
MSPALRPPTRRAIKAAVALSSGGKDSILALHMAVEAGYRVQDLVTVLPEDPESRLYHTHNVHHVQQVARALQVDWRPVRAPVGDEEGALADVLGQLRAPTVVTGGIASTFQRTRFGRIAAAAGAQVYAPLWGLLAPQVYQALESRHIDAVVVAVAALGLDREWLGQHLTPAKVTQLLVAAARYRFDPTGEGGDLDTFVLDAPLYTRRLEITSAEEEWHGDRGVLRITRLRSVAKAEQIIKRASAVMRTRPNRAA